VVRVLLQLERRADAISRDFNSLQLGQKNHFCISCDLKEGQYAFACRGMMQRGVRTAQACENMTVAQPRTWAKMTLRTCVVVAFW